MLNETPPEAARAAKTLDYGIDTVFSDAIKAICGLSSIAQVTNTQKQAVTFLTESKINLRSNIKVIADQLMWKPHIAFYGETNAGKSTLIEALRLYFGEKNTDVGISIGDGRSDFTTKAAVYPCNFQDHAFTLIDVPGIEGKERAVDDAIKRALAHSQVVFYITPDARPPQGGESDREGTLEKIARQLKPQAKVWAIWNKKIHSPRALLKPLLVEGSDEWCSLHEGNNSLNAKMREVLDTRYQTCLPVSARPAFLALAGHLAPESKLAAERARFLERIPETELLKASGIDQVVDLCIKGIPSAVDIRQTNFGKLTAPILDLADEISKKGKEAFLKPANELKSAIGNFESRLENIADDARRNLRRLSDELIQKTITSVRVQMIDAIEAGIDNDKDLKIKVESVLQKEKSLLEEAIQHAVKKLITDTQRSLSDALKIMKSELAQGNVFSIPGFTANFDHTIEINTENGVDWIKLGASVVAGALAVLLTGGWALILGIVGALMSAWNAIASFFNSGYRKDQQMKALNGKLYLVRKELSLSVPKKMDEIADEVAKAVHSQVQPFEKLYADYDKAGRTLLDVSRKLSKLADSAVPDLAT